MNLFKFRMKVIESSKNIIKLNLDHIFLSHVTCLTSFITH